jgi:hypothetical protein
MFVRFTPQDQPQGQQLQLEIDPQTLNPANQPMPTFLMHVPNHWVVNQEGNVFVVRFFVPPVPPQPPIYLFQLEIDANDVLTIWQLVDGNPGVVLYSTLIVSPQLAEEVKQQFRDGMPVFEVTFSRFEENNEMNNASTVTMNGYETNRTNETMNGGKRKYRCYSNRKQSRRYRRKKRTLRRTRKVN